MRKGDVVLIPFPFTDLSGQKNRPAVVLISAELDITVAFITTQLKWQEPTDLILLPTASSGIKKQSVVRLNKIATIDANLALGKLGELSEAEIEQLNTNLKKLLQLD